MFSALLAGFLLPTVAAAPKIPVASYKLQMDEYNIELSDFRFPSGLRILFQSERSQPIVAITSVIDRGSEFDQEGVDGIAHILEHLAFRANHGGVKNWDLIKQMGGSINASTSVDWTNYMTVAPRDALIPLMRIEVLRLKDTVANVNEQDVITESEIARNELRMRYENAAVGAAWDELGLALFPPGHPYARSTIGTHETIGNIDLESVQEFARDNYRPEYTTLVIVGDFDLEEAGGLIFDAFAGNEDILMSPGDAEAYRALETENDRIGYLNTWVPALNEFMGAASKTPFPARVDCSDPKRFDMPMPQQKLGTDAIPRVQGMIDYETVIVAWSLPGGYCDDQPVMQMTAGLLTNYIRRELYPTWEYEKEDSELEGLGCFLQAEQYASSLICFVEKKAGAGYSPEKIAEKVQDSLFLQWEQYDPNMVNTFLQWNFNYARSISMASMLQSVDLVSSLGGRATTTAMFTHFTGDPAFYSTNMNWLNNINPTATREMALKYVTRERAVAVIVEPMNEEERERREAAAKKDSRSEKVQEYHATQDADRYKSVYTNDKVTPEFIESQVVQPDLTKLRTFTLDNGLKVAILPYGEAPLARISLHTLGDSRTEHIPGLNSMANYSHLISDKSRESLLAVAGFMGGSATDISVSLPSGNIEAGLNKIRWMVEESNYDWRSRYERKKKVKSWAKTAKKDSKYPETWADRYGNERLFPDHILGEWIHPDAYMAMSKIPKYELEEWIYTRWQPMNAELYIVGKVDAAETEQVVRNYFESWEYQGQQNAGSIGLIAPPTQFPERQILIFDKPIATQSQIELTCRIDTQNKKQDSPKASVVGNVLSEDVWRRLREEAGVTYGAYAYGYVRDEGTGILGMQTLVQNDAVGFAIESMYKIVEDGHAGNIKESSISTAKMTMAREYVLGQQSGGQMLTRIQGTGVNELDYFTTFPKLLSSVSKSDFPVLLEPCKGREVITIVGPKTYAVEQLTELGFSFEVIEWEKEHENLLTPKELKKLLKARAEEEEAKSEG